MSNPWLDVPLSEYEGHMNASAVDQLTALSALFGETLLARKPVSVAILGVAGGNGLERIDPALTKRIVGVDCNPEYLAAVRKRFSHMPSLELHCADLSCQTLAIEPVELVHAALIFEHAGLDLCLENALRLKANGGALSVVLQLPSVSAQAVSPTGYASIQQLGAHFAFVEPAQLSARLSGCGLRLVSESRTMLPGGKAFWHGLFA
jgi:hypothetical protein